MGFKELESYKKEKVKENEEELARLYVQKNSELENIFSNSLFFSMYK